MSNLPFIGQVFAQTEESTLSGVGVGTDLPTYLVFLTTLLMVGLGGRLLIFRKS